MLNASARLSLALVVTAGILTLLGSELEEREPSAPPVPVTVAFALTGPAVGLARELETRTATLGNLQLRGDYASQQGNRLSLNRTRVSLDPGSSFGIAVRAKSSSELLEGTAAIEIVDLFDIGVTRAPTTGQFTSDFDGTTTIVTATAAGAEVLVGDATAPAVFSWERFAGLADDAGAGLDVRMASAAFTMMRAVLRAVLLAEDLIDDIENNRTELEGIGVGTPLTLDCTNTTEDGDGESRLFWRRDAVGTGQGSVGIGDDFEARYENCRRARSRRFLEGEIFADDYVPQTGSGLRSFGIDLDLRSLFDAEAMIDLDTTPSTSAPRYTGELSLSYTEIPDPVQR